MGHYYHSSELQLTVQLNYNAMMNATLGFGRLQTSFKYPCRTNQRETYLHYT